MLDAKHVNQFFSNYFHPDILWEKGLIGKLEAIGIAISWPTLFIPMIMRIGLLASEFCLKGKVSDKKIPGRIEDIHESGASQFRQLNIPATFQNSSLVSPIVSNPRFEDKVEQMFNNLDDLNEKFLKETEEKVEHICLQKLEDLVNMHPQGSEARNNAQEILDRYKLSMVLLEKDKKDLKKIIHGSL